MKACRTESKCICARKNGESEYIMKDYMIRGMAAEGQIRVFAANTRELVEEAKNKHLTSPIATAALGRLLTGAAMMGSMMKNDADLLTIQIKGDGPIQGLTVTADSHGNVKGYAHNPAVMLPPKNGKLDVGGAIGRGMMHVIKDMGLKDPYVGQIALQSAEIGDDLTYYFTTSEQVPSSVGLGVLMERDNTVRHAGGFIVQVMPFADEETIAKLEENIASITSVTKLLEENTLEEMVEIVLKDLKPEITEERELRFACNCSKERIEKALISIGKEERQKMIDDGEDIEVKCHFCNTPYNFTVGELESLG